MRALDLNKLSAAAAAAEQKKVFVCRLRKHTGERSREDAINLAMQKSNQHADTN